MFFALCRSVCLTAVLVLLSICFACLYVINCVLLKMFICVKSMCVVYVCVFVHIELLCS